MNKSYLPKLEGQYVRLRPRVKNDSGAEADADWLVQRVQGETLELRRVDGSEMLVIGADHIHEYVSDPSRGSNPARYGFLNLHVQVFLSGGKGFVEPLPSPRVGLRVPSIQFSAVESVQARAARLARQMADEQARQALIESGKGVSLTREEADRLLAALDGLASADESGLTFKVAKEARGRAVYLHGFSLTCVWSNSIVNSVRDARLHVKVWRGNVDFGGLWYADDTRELRTKRFAPDFTTAEEPVWRDEKGGDALTTKQVADECVTMLLEQVEKASGRRR